MSETNKPMRPELWGFIESCMASAKTNALKMLEKVLLANDGNESRSGWAIDNYTAHLKAEQGRMGYRPPKEGRT